MARYLIEDNYEDMVEYNPDLSTSALIVKSILKNKLNSYVILSDEETEELRKRISEVKNISNPFQYLYDFKELIADALKKLYNDLDSHECTKSQLLHYFHLFDVTMSKPYKEQIILDLFNFNKDIERLPYDEIKELYLKYDDDNADHEQ